MGGIPIPKRGYITALSKIGIESGRILFKDELEGIFFTWDSLHGELEVFNKRGIHLGTVNAETGLWTGKAVKGRRISKQN
ncbi:colicin E3/pyocin S6 family cytotoxin [Planctobacterium marinum]|uniref:colicin E3/pyocin S6 family cytotoxin n=1 Tax=Planctobacterium marinum TaxID=1631968 RepID=UPI001E487A72|nr:colicin E3/pyocin S6 family cytotoxin [Planctobacterium marinum]MCC2608001.1 hypothetical protein [Planctobacterium marinum]